MKRKYKIFILSLVFAACALPAFRPTAALAAPVYQVDAEVLSPHRAYSSAGIIKGLYASGDRLYLNGSGDGGSDGIYDFPTGDPQSVLFTAFQADVFAQLPSGITAGLDINAETLTILGRLGTVTETLAGERPSAIAIASVGSDYTLYVACASDIKVYDLTALGALTQSAVYPTGIRGITDMIYLRAAAGTSAEKLVIVGTDSDNGGKNAVYGYDLTNNLENKIYVGTGLRKIAASADSRELTLSAMSGLITIDAATGASVRNYYINANIDISSGRLAYADSLAVIDGKLYVADLDGNAVQVFRLSDLTYASTFIAAGGAEAGRLSLPQSAHISNNEVYITEKGNNRLSAVSKNQTRVPSYAFYNPYLAVTDADGRVYVADKNGTRLSVFDSELTVLEQRPFTGITDIAVSGNNMVFVADTDGADGSIKYYSSGGYRGELTPLDGVSKLFARGGEKSVYAIAGGVPYKVPYDGLPVPLTAPVLDGTDYDMDYEGKIFELKDNQINRYTQSGGVYALDATLTLKPLSPAYQIRKLTSLSINFHDSDSPEAIAGYGALTLADEGSDCVFVINDVAQTGVTLFDADGYTHPGADGALEVKFTEAPKTILYEYPDINKPLALLAKDARLLVLEEDLAPVSEYFSYVLYEVDYPITHYGKTYSKTLLAGYVLKDNLTPALPKTPAPYAVGRILHDNTKIYKYPFVYSAGAAVLMRGETIATAAFCYPYVDITDTGFIAVALPGGSVGFVNANGIIHQSYEVADPDKHTDATIITDNLIGAPLYVLQDGNYVLSSEPPLKNGTRIKLANKFDAGAEYTEVIIYNDFGQLRGYVETKYVDTDSASILQVTALVIIVITVASGVILYAYYRSRRRRVDASA